MKGRKNRIYREGCAHHLYLKALGGNVLFYRTEDFIYFLSLVYVLARRHSISIGAVCIMFNHVHLFVKPVPKAVFEAFCRDLQSIFTLGMNSEYHRKGPMMMQAGFAPKGSWKSILSCLSYIANNPVAGKICSRAIEYKWNMLAYFVSDHPFSEKIVKRYCGFKMRKALRIIDDCLAKEKVLNHAIQRLIFKDLSGQEKKQVTDYILSRYNPVDKEAFISRYGSFTDAVTVIDTTTGAEHDLTEPWEDYSVYLKMLVATRASFMDYQGFRFHEMAEADLLALCRQLSKIKNATPEHIRRFLHLEK